MTEIISLDYIGQGLIIWTGERQCRDRALPRLDYVRRNVRGT